jgi:pimeloyl-ACP methyl ester carboxylesterase
MRTAAAALSLALAVGLGACTAEEPADDTTPEQAATSATPADFEEAECPADVASVVVGEVACGYLTVPEDRAEPERDVRLFVARIEPPEVLHEDPMFVAGTDLASLPNYGGVAPLAQRVGREVIIMDTRGVGHSEPSLACPEVDELRETALATATDDPETRTAFLDAVASCHDRLAADGVDVAAYHLSAMAADAEDLRAALSIDEWNVVTYGTASRIAFEMLRQAPDHLRSVLLDSPEVPGTDPRAIAVDATRASLVDVLDACAADNACAAAFPGAGTLLDRALAEVADQPVTLSMEAAGQEPAQVLLDDALLLRLLRGMVSDGGSSGSFMRPAAIPAVLDGAVTRRLEGLATTLATTVAGSPTYCLGYQPKCLPQHRVSVGTAYSVLCHDIDPLHDRVDAVRAVAADEPGYAAAYGDNPSLDVCDAWPVAASDDTSSVVDSPVDSDVPVLALVGAFAPYSPEDLVRGALAGVPAATVVVDPTGGHNVMGSDCLVSIRGAWLDDLDLTASEQDCLADQTTDWVTDLSELGAVPVPAGASIPTPASADGLEGAWEADLSRAELLDDTTGGLYKDTAQMTYLWACFAADSHRRTA